MSGQLAGWKRWVAMAAIAAAGFGSDGVAGGAQTAPTGFVNQLMPQPASLMAGKGELKLTARLDVHTQGVQSGRLDRAVARMMRQLSERTALPFATGGTDQTLGIAAPAEHGVGPRLTLRVRSEGQAVQGLDEDESYSLTVAEDGVTIEAATVAGAMHGLQTLLQLVQPAGDGYGLPLVTIKDEPRFRWRGLMIDTGRHFEPVAVIKRTLDGMALVKLNVFHWHLTEDQGFRIESKKFPELTGKGSDGLFYTQEEAREVVRYARERGIRVVPEFEMPGHSTAWLVAHPELSSGKAPEGIRREFGISEVALDPTREETYKFVEAFLTEMTQIFPDEYLHIGGDETQSPDWKNNPRILSFMKQHDLKDPDALQAYFNQRVLKILTGLKRKMVGWDEILNPALPKTVVVQSWRGEESLVKGAKQGYQGVLSAPYYLDAMKTAGVHYLADPAPSSLDLTAEQRRLILGGEVCMWAEQLNERTIDSRIWPRTAAMAERFWSPENVKDVDDMYRRLDATSVALESVGLRHLSQEEVGLRQLAGTEQIDALRVFATAFEPVSFSDRYQQQKTSQTTVLDRFVDAVRPDPPSRREMDALVREFLRDPKTGSEAQRRLANRLANLQASVPVVEEQMHGAPRLQEMETRAQQLGQLTALGIEAMAFLSGETTPPAGWKDRATQAVQAAKRSSAIVRFTLLDAMTELFSAVK